MTSIFYHNTLSPTRTSVKKKGTAAHVIIVSGIGSDITNSKYLNGRLIKRTYKPRMYLIVANKQMDEIIIAECLKPCTSQFAG